MKYTGVIFVAFISAVVIAPLTYMIADNEPPYEYDADGSYIIPGNTRAGQQVTVHWKFTRVNRVCRGSIIRHIVDKKTNVDTTYDPMSAAASVDLQRDYFERVFTLPPTITVGPKWYYSEGRYACNLLQHFYPLVTRTPRISFEVIE